MNRRVSTTIQVWPL